MTITTWFKLNEHNNNAHMHLYPEIPLHYVCKNSTRSLTHRISKALLSVGCTVFLRNGNI